MNHHANDCMLCGAELEYLAAPREMECALCHRTFSSDARCKNGHFVCDECHRKNADGLTLETCLHTASRNPIAIMQGLMAKPPFHMHGPEHHFLVGAALLAAYHNCGGEVDLAEALPDLLRRSKKVPGGACGYWGCCGAAVSAGMFLSIVTESTPLAERPWGLSNAMTGRALSAIAATGGPRCCKRDSFTAVREAVDFTAEKLGVQMEAPDRIRCGFFPQNHECLGARCPYHPGYGAE